MAEYKLFGSGPQFPKGHNQSAETASEALTKFDAVKKLCGSVKATDPNGNDVSRSDLAQIADAELAAQREALKAKNA